VRSRRGIFLRMGRRLRGVFHIIIWTSWRSWAREGREYSSQNYRNAIEPCSPHRCCCPISEKWSSKSATQIFCYMSNLFEHSSIA